MYESRQKDPRSRGLEVSRSRGLGLGFGVCGLGFRVYSLESSIPAVGCRDLSLGLRS